MILGLKVVIVMPAYKAEQTLKRTFDGIPHDIVDKVILVDDDSDERTAQEAQKLGIEVFTHRNNLGYGANQKTCYREALRSGADIVVMLHPDYQYEPRLVTAMAAMVASGVYDVVLGSRILGGGALRGGMPRYKYFSEASSINFLTSVIYGSGVVATSIKYRLWKWHLMKTKLFNTSGTYRLAADYYRPYKADSHPPPS